VTRAALLAALALAGCDGKSPAPVPSATPSAVATATAPAQQIGAISGLTGQTSALTGTVSDFVVERTATETRVQLAADTLFDFDKATLSPAAQANLQRTADLVRAGGAGTVTVVGHTDAKGADGYNLDLSTRRAEAVVAWLKGQPDMAARPFAAVGRGEAEPVAPNARADGGDDPEGRAKNRRVVVNIPR
jgi:outer membrane protein OmpA-like peptidoglycan-associated protein